MRLLLGNRFAVVALNYYFFAVALINFARLAVSIASSESSGHGQAITTGGRGRRDLIGPVDGGFDRERESTVCRLGYDFPDIYDGNTFLGAAERLQLFSSLVLDPQILLLRAAPPPIEIVRQAGTHVEFRVRNDSPFFSTAAASYFDFSKEKQQHFPPTDAEAAPPLTARRTYTVFPSDAMSSRCHESGDNFSQTDTTHTSSSEVLKARCPPTGKCVCAAPRRRRRQRQQVLGRW